VGGHPPERVGRARRPASTSRSTSCGRSRSRRSCTGVAGGLLAADSGQLFITTFPTSDSILLLAVVLMGGIYSLWGAVVAGLLMQLLPALLDNWGVPADLAHDPVRRRRPAGPAHRAAGLVYQFPRDMAKLGTADRRLVAGARRADAGGAG
jgi:hypothetical protein